ncbi:MAG: SDR family oxidoreductase [Alphaproteobacteria bacterium]|nr:SDR family oxidoreductase [Alphaproteobacteria bacterium]
MFSLAARRALVTGANTGIGQAIAVGLAQTGAQVICAGRRACDETVAMIEAEGGTASQVAVDFADPMAGQGLFTDEPIDILVNNAGMQFRSSLEAFPPEKFDQVIATNLTSVFNVSQPVSRHMIARGAGRIINICSLLSDMSRPSVAPYAATKAAVANLTRGMAVDWARHGLNINGIAPGYFATELNEALLSDDKFNSWIETRTPMGRWGQPEELGGAVVFLASPASAFVNGHILYVDGAFTATV